MSIGYSGFVDFTCYMKDRRDDKVKDCQCTVVVKHIKSSLVYILLLEEKGFGDRLPQSRYNK